MKKSITKENVIKALESEVLCRRYFFEKKRLLTPPGCKVCAVGAVLRHMSFEKWGRKNKLDLNHIGWASLHDADPVGQDPYDLLKDKQYLAALSNYFEDGNSKKKCIAFVEKNFPEKLIVEINI